MNKDQKDKLIHQLFIGMVVDVIGFEKTLELLKKASEKINKIDNIK